MTGQKFATRWIIAVLSTIVIGAIFPFILAPLTHATGCRSVGGACGAVALVLGIYLRFPIVIGVGIYITYLAWRRSRTLGLLPWGSLFILITYIVSGPALFEFGNFWAASFALGLDSSQALMAFGFLLVGLIGLSCLNGRGIEQSRMLSRMATLAAGGLTSILLLPHAVGAFAFLPFIGLSLFELKISMFGVFRPIYMIAGSHLMTALMVAFGLSLFFWVRAERTLPTPVEGE